MYKYYIKMKNKLYENYVNGEITLEQREELLERAKNDFMFMEKATRKQYSLEAFKKKYKYDSKNNTIVVDGEIYDIDINTNNPIIKIINDNGKVVSKLRQIGVLYSNSDTPMIVLDDDFFKLKNSKRRDAELQHEIGHIKSDCVTNNGHTAQHVIQLNYEKYMESLFNKCKHKYADLDIPDELMKDVVVQKAKENGITKSTYKLNESEKQQQKIIKEIRQYIEKKYISRVRDGNTHTTRSEIEADRYSADHSSEKDLKKTLRERRKMSTTDKAIKKEIAVMDKIEKNILPMPKSKEVIKIARKDKNKSQNNDYEIRSAALKDKKLKDNPIYKK